MNIAHIPIEIGNRHQTILKQIIQWHSVLYEIFQHIHDEGLRNKKFPCGVQTVSAACPASYLNDSGIP
jgi:hypothetical protein